jgi:hypothetical protein
MSRLSRLRYSCSFHRKYLSKALAIGIVIIATMMVLLPVQAQPLDITPNGILFHRDNYDYGPSIIQQGNTRQYWWCGEGTDPLTGMATDTIYYRTYNVSTGLYSPITMVLYPSQGPGVWDEAYTCDPSVIRGSFIDPDNGQNYTYAMYYTATDRGPGGIDAGTSLDGTNNRIGVAFSNDGLSWVKYAQNPVIFPQIIPTDAYGAGQAATYNGGGETGLSLFYTDTSTSVGTRMWIRHSSDGLHFSAPTLISNQGMLADQQPGMANSDFAYDYTSEQFYAALGLPGRSGDRDTYHIGLYRVAASDLMNGQGTWEALGFIDTNLTGSYLNASPGLVRDPAGNITPFLPSVEVVFTEGTNDPGTWDLSSATWNPTANTFLFKRYYNASITSHWVTTGFIASGYTYESTLGYLYTSPQTGTIALYGCVAGGFGGTDHFVSTDPGCEGQFVLGFNGWIYSSPPAGISTVALYRCYTGIDHFVSTDPGCEGRKTESLLGYARTQS